MKTTAEIEHTEKEMAEKKKALDGDQKQCADALSRLKMKLSPAERSGRIREEIAGTRAKIAETTKIVALAEEKGRQEKSAQAGREETRKTFDNAGKALQEARHKLEQAGLDYERLNRDCAALTEELEKTRAAVLADVGPFGIDGIPLEGLGGVLKDLTGRKDLWQAKDAEKTALEKKIGELTAGLEKHKALLAKLEEDLALRRKDRDGLKGEHESLRAVPPGIVRGKERRRGGKRACGCSWIRLTESWKRPAKITD